jgi:hypothetical protein
MLRTAHVVFSSLIASVAVLSPPSSPLPLHLLFTTLIVLLSFAVAMKGFKRQPRKDKPWQKKKNAQLESQGHSYMRLMLFIAR